MYDLNSMELHSHSTLSIVQLAHHNCPRNNYLIVVVILLVVLLDNCIFV